MNDNFEENSKARTVKALGISLIILGIIAGFVFVSQDNLLSTILCWVIGILSGIMLIAFSEVIQLLQNIYTTNNEILKLNAPIKSAKIIDSEPIDVSKMTPEEYQEYLNKNYVPENK